LSINETGSFHIESGVKGEIMRTSKKDVELQRDLVPSHLDSKSDVVVEFRHDEES
jgi:hypothetical protein